MKKLLLFPINQITTTLLNNRKAIKNYEVLYLASFKEDKNSLVNYQDDYGIKCFFNLKEAVESTDEVFLIDNIMNKLPGDYYSIIDAANKIGRRVLLSRNLITELKLNESEYDNLVIIDANDKRPKIPGIKYKYQINKPVIGVLGLGENCNKFDVQLMLTIQLRKRGYNPYVICSNPAGILFDTHTLPDFIFEDHLSLEDKIIGLNHYIFDIIRIEKPDMIILGFPGGITPLGINNEFYHFSEVSYVIGNAVSCDTGILNIYFPDYINNDDIGVLKSICLYKYNIHIDSIGVSTQKLDYSEEFDKHSYLFYSKSMYEKFFPEIQGILEPIINVSDQDRFKEGISRYLDSLESFPNSL